MARNIPLLKDLDAFSWWTFTDIFEEGGMQDRPFEASGGSSWGLISRQSVPKPVYRFFQLLKDAGDHIIPLTSITQTQSKKGGGELVRGADGPVSIFITANASASENVLATRTHLMIYASNYLPTAVSGETPSPANVTLRLAGVDNVSTVTIRRIDEQHGDAFVLWQSWGADSGHVTRDSEGPWYMNVSQVDRLVAASEVRAEQFEAYVADDGVCPIKFSLPPHSAVRIDVTVNLFTVPSSPVDWV